MACLGIVLLLASGCWRAVGNGKITTSLGLAYPLTDVGDANKRAAQKLGAMDAAGQLNAAAISSRLNESLQDTLRLRAAATVSVPTTGTAVLPAIPDLPSADHTTLTTASFSDVAKAAALLDTIELSPFAKITNMRDIQESLNIAELRFKFDSLVHSGYDFYFFPVTLSVNPGTKTEQNFLADVRFDMGDKVTMDLIREEFRRIITDSANNDAVTTILKQLIEEHGGKTEEELKESKERHYSRAIVKIAAAIINDGAVPCGQNGGHIKIPQVALDDLKIALVTYYISNKPGSISPHDESNFATGSAKCRLLCGEPKRECGHGQPDVSTLAGAIDSLIGKLRDKTLRGEGAAAARRELCIYNLLMGIQDAQVFMISPLRQMDQRSESLARRIQIEQALQLSGSGPVGQGAAAAANLGADRLKRMESDFATLTRFPRSTGYLESNSFGWRIYPTASLDPGRFRTRYTMEPGARDFMVIVAINRWANNLFEIPTAELTSVTRSLSSDIKVQNKIVVSLEAGANLKLMDEKAALTELHCQREEYVKLQQEIADIKSGLGNNVSKSIKIHSHSRWIGTRHILFWNRELPPENQPNQNYFIEEDRGLLLPLGKGVLNTLGWIVGTPAKCVDESKGRGTLSLILPAQAPNVEAYLAAAQPQGIAFPSVIKDKPAIVQIEGKGFSQNTRVVFNGEALVPTSYDRTTLFVQIDPNKAKPKLFPYTLVVQDGPSRVAIVSKGQSDRTPAIINVEGPPETPKPKEPAVAMTAPPTVLPGAFVNLAFTDPELKRELPNQDQIQVRVGPQLAEVVLFDKKKGAFGFYVPLLNEGSSKQLPVLVTINNIGIFRVPETLNYAAEVSAEDSAIRLRIMP